jgi:hypothetical protein
MVAAAILITSLAILMETQTAAIAMTREANRMVTGANLAQEKLTEVQLQLEEEGFGDQDICESGDFDEFGDESIDLEFGDALDAYHFEWCVSEIDLALAGDLMGMAGNLAGSGYVNESSTGTGGTDAAAGGIPDLGALGFSNEMMTEMLGRYIREVRVRVWWGKDSKEAEENGDEIEVVSHAINPTGVITAMGGQDDGEGDE